MLNIHKINIYLRWNLKVVLMMMMIKFRMVVTGLAPG